MKYQTLLLDALRLHFDEHMSRLDVGRQPGIPKRTIRDLFVRFKKQEVSWPLPDSMTSDKLESMLCPARITADIIETPDIPEPALVEEPIEGCGASFIWPQIARRMKLPALIYSTKPLISQALRFKCGRYQRPEGFPFAVPSTVLASA